LRKTTIQAVELGSYCFDLTKTLAHEKVSRGGDEHPIDFGADEQLKVSGIEREQHFAVRGQSGNQHGLVFAGSEQKGTLGREGVRHPSEAVEQVSPSIRGFRSEFDDVAGHLGPTVSG